MTTMTTEVKGMTVDNYASITEEQVSSLRSSDTWLHDSLEKAKNHLSPDIKYNFVFNKEELTNEDKNRVLEHLKHCAACKQEITSFEEHYEIYANLPELEY